MNKGFASLVLAAVALSVTAGELEVAKEALRDGLWEVARLNAAKVDSDEARLVVLESYAREKKWNSLLKAFDGFIGVDGDGFVYYQALALAELGRLDEARKALAARKFAVPPYSVLSARLKAKVEMGAGEPGAALKILQATDFAVDSDSKMEAARILDVNGDRRGAEKLWREVASDTNSTERAATVAAVSLGDIVLVRKAYETVREPELRRLAGLRLGALLIGSEAGFEEGATLIRAVVRDSPDAEGAREAFTQLADAYLTRGEYQQAADAFKNTVEIWPDAAKSVTVNEGRAWSLRKLGRNEEALEALARAEDVATDVEDRATAVLEQGDVLSEAGRGAESLAKYREVLEKYPKTKAGEKLKELVKLRELESHGRELFKSYSFKEALEVFERLGASDPARKPRADYFRALCLYGLGRDTEAWDLASGLAKGSEDDSIRMEATLWLAKLSYNRGMWRESHDLFKSYATNAVAKASKAPAALLWSARAAFTANDFQLAVETASALAERYPGTPEATAGYLLQGEALIERSRFDEAVLVLERAALAEGIAASDRLKAQLLRADALFAMGADNPGRYHEALDTYRAVLLGESLTPSVRLSVSFKIGRTLEKLKKPDDAINQYYSEVVLAYRNASAQDRATFDDEARAAFVRAAFRLADEYESRGRDVAAMNILELVVLSDVPAADEARKRIGRIQAKGKFL